MCSLGRAGSTPALGTMFYAYILESIKTKSLYKGHTKDLDKRIEQHNAGRTLSTKHGIPWKLVYFESFQTKKEAILREKYFKTAAGRRFIKTLNL
ncbi:GIY-YIG nuclease family protein [Ekhidna sp.]|uniref:GIY-YIG nuclease family protein n=1 Tax=Ekhidna sp. TaxID=2608089 RepID=UPI003B59E797